MIVEHARSSCRLFCARPELRRQSNNRQVECYVFFSSSCWIAASPLDCRREKTQGGRESRSTATRRRWYDGVSGKIHTDEKKGRKSTSSRRSSHSSWVKLKFIYSRYLAKLVVAARRVACLMSRNLAHSDSTQALGGRGQSAIKFTLLAPFFLSPLATRMSQLFLHLTSIYCHFN